MVLKFSFANEIHRCSEFPTQFDQLHNFLASTFKAQLPEKYQLRYVLPGTEAELVVANQKDYDELLKLDSSKPIKITIHEAISFVDNGKGLISDYEYLGENKNVEAQGVVEENAPGLEKIVEQMSESVIVPQVNKQLPYFSIVPSQPQGENIRQIVKECIKEQIPFIISQVKDAILKELRAGPQAQPQVKDLIIKEVHVEGKKGQHADNAFYKKNDEPEDFYKPEYIKPVDHDFAEAKHNHHNEEEIIELQVQEEKGNAFFAKIKDIGQAIKGKVVDLPGKAMNALDDWSHKIEGDPYVVIEEGRYPQSVVDKANGLKEVFIEENLKTLLDFIYRYPRTANLEQLAHAFLFKDQQNQDQGEGQGEQHHQAENLDEPAQGNVGINGGQPENKEFWV